MTMTTATTAITSFAVVLLCCTVSGQVYNRILSSNEQTSGSRHDQTNRSNQASGLHVDPSNTTKCTSDRRCPDLNGSCCTANPTFCCAFGYDCVTSANATSICSPQDKSNPFLFDVAAYSTCKADSVIEQIFSFTTEKGNVVHFPYYAETPLTDLNASISNVVVVVHGAVRNAGDYFCAVHEANVLKGTEHTTAVIAPHFLDSNDNDTSHKTLLRWNDGLDTNGVWRDGYPDSLNQTSSYAVMDNIIAALAAKFLITNITVVGHSSGGQYVQRYALTNNATQNNATRFKYVIANPSSYCYLDGSRPINGSFQIPSDQNNCDGNYNNWGWGLATKSYVPPYVASAMGLQPNNTNTTNMRIKDYYQRDVTYLLGANDTCTNVTEKEGCPSSGLETTCSDELEGPSRLLRGHHFFSFVNSQSITDHVLVEVPNSGHDHILMFQSPTGRDVIFPPSPPPSPSPPPTPPPSPPPTHKPTPSPNQNKRMRLDKDEGYFLEVGVGSLVVLLIFIVCAVRRKSTPAPEKRKSGPEYSGF